MARTRSARPAKRRAAGGLVNSDQEPEQLTPQPVDVVVMADGDGLGMPSANGNSIEIPHDDGTLTIDLNPQPDAKPESDKFNDNLAEFIHPFELGRISNMLLDGIDQDEQDRSEWMTQRADGMDLLAVKVERPGQGVVVSSPSQSPGQSMVRDPVMLESVTRFQANAYGELCPSDGPCKGVNYGDATTDNDKLAEDFEDDFNFYLTRVATEYYPDTRKMLFWVGYASGMFKKVYTCPLRRRPVSESVDGADLILPANITDLHNAGRVTQRINMRQSVMRRMQLAGAYRDIQLGTPTPEPTAIQEKTGAITGIDVKPDRPEDQDYTVYECYCELDIEGFEHTERGKPTGLPLPYRVVIDKDSREILEVRRNWREDDEDMKAKIPFVAFSYITGIGVYGLGLLHYLGNLTMALTAMLRLAIDNGMFANFPGFLFESSAGRQKTNNFQVPPGGGAPVDTGGKPLKDAVMALPFHEMGPAFVQLMGQVRDVAMRLGGTAETPIGEGKQDAPVGTTLAMIEQATKIEGGVHKALHAAQSEELSLLKEEFRDDPEALWRGNKRPALGKDSAMRLQRFKQALEDCNIEPASDPNVPSHMHRLMTANGLLQMQQGAPPGTFLPNVVYERAAAMMKIDDFQSMLAPPQQPQQPPPDPAMVAAILSGQIADKRLELDKLKLMIDALNKHKDRESKESIEALKVAEGLAQHPESNPQVLNALMQQGPLADLAKEGAPNPMAAAPGDAQQPQPPAPALEPDQAMPVPAHVMMRRGDIPNQGAPLGAPPPGGGLARGGAIPDEPLSLDDLIDSWHPDAAAILAAARREEMERLAHDEANRAAWAALERYSRVFPHADGVH